MSMRASRSTKQSKYCLRGASHHLCRINARANIEADKPVTSVTCRHGVNSSTGQLACRRRRRQNLVCAAVAGRWRRKKAPVLKWAVECCWLISRIRRRQLPSARSSEKRKAMAPAGREELVYSSRRGAIRGVGCLSWPAPLNEKWPESSEMAWPMKWPVYKAGCCSWH